MKKVIIYSEIEDKKSLVEESTSLTPLDSLIQCLDVMDFNAALAKSNPLKYSSPHLDEVKWIDLTFIENGK